MMTKLRFARWVCALALIAAPAFSWGSDATPAQVSFHTQIRPLLQANCQGCHQPAKPLGNYTMMTVVQLLKPGESGETPVVAGKPDESYLVKQITRPNPETAPEMPKGRDPLKPEQITLIRTWIEQGAKDDSPASTGPVIDAEHPPTYAAAPVITGLSYSGDGQLLAVSGFHEVLLHKADGSQLVGRLVGLSERIESLAFSPDSKKLAVTGGAPCQFGEVQIWDVATRKIQAAVSVTYDTVYGASWSTDGTRVAFGCTDKSLRAIDSASGEQVLFQGASSDWVLATVWSTDSSHLISVGRDRAAKLTEVKTQRFIDNITSITPGALKGGLQSVDRHPKKDEILVGGADGTPKIYKIYRTEKRVIGDDFNFIRAMPAMPGRLFSVKFSPDGSKVVAGSSFQGKGEVRVYETDTGKQIAVLEGQQGGVFAVAFNADGTQVASGGFDGIVRINDAATGKLIHQFVPVPLTATTP